MAHFIKSVLLDLKDKNLRFNNLTFVLPSKRAGLFLKHQLSDLLDQPIFSPDIVSIEDFVEDISGLHQVGNIELLFNFYTTYKSLTKTSDLESFESFSKWGHTLLQDFNEIDRYLIAQDKIFDYLNAIKEINHWSLEVHQTDLIKTHLKFWKRLKQYYLAFTEELLASKKGYQGLLYREASENLESYIANNPNKQHVFLGFNALNKAESNIIQGLLQNDLAHIYWDTDKLFFEDPIHDAGFFMRQHANHWPYFKKNNFNWTSSQYSSQKDIHIIGTPKFVGQAKYIGQLLQEISLDNPTLKNVALVLGEEHLLVPVLNSIPTSIPAFNVTMGLPLKFVPLATLFESLFSIHKGQPKSYYYKDVIRILSHPTVQTLFSASASDGADNIIQHIQKYNWVYMSSGMLAELSKEASGLINLLFEPWADNANLALKHCTALIFKLKASYDDLKFEKRLELEQLYRFHLLFNQLAELNKTYSHLGSVAALQSVYNELLVTETLDFKGEPLEGLQIMGVLESRVLDFDTVIISSANEGILPAGKTNNSFIPFDVKIENGLPTFKEKDAVYTYHFYHLLQRAKRVFIIYNTEIDTLKGGEKSRFITQLEIEGIHKLQQSIATPTIPIGEEKTQQVHKTDAVMDKLQELAQKGFSPSSLSNYIRNPIDFYLDKVLDIKEFEDVEENIAAKTLGTVIHNTLEDFYKPFENKILTLNNLESFKSKIQQTVTRQFKRIYKDGDFSTGKNLIVFEIAKRYISNFIDLEIAAIKNGDTIKILAIEMDAAISFSIPDLDFPVTLKGKVDRVDLYNGTIRIIDYKSGKVEQSKVEIVDWEDLTSDYDKFSKSFQILCYAFMMHKNGHITLPIEAGIISFKNLNAGFLKFGIKPAARSQTRDQIITEETLRAFQEQLNILILEIFNPKIDFIEKKLN